MNSSQQVLPELSLLEIFRFQCPNAYFMNTTETTPIVGFQHARDLIDSRAPGFIRIFLPYWEKDDPFSTTRGAYASTGSPTDECGTLFPLALLHMAQEVYSRLFQIIQYLQVIRRMHLLKLEKKRGQRISQRPRQRVDGLAMSLTLAEIYKDWDTVGEQAQTARKQRFRKENRLARRWLLVAARLSFGVLLICSKQLEREM
ncbi:hypothetical protein BDV29DRAFT_194673 [Aspergillus leporis]|jgi:hypothetical protein|uniref:Uncharacterized protein n=1 Tax=Aspergillus leporis TaxID=41062 RepID=A0A5N5WRA2_9EURO|nr:hypothetical protein BDV29DRAFT_194673 [Aspergillus leporis]